jgi:hypothetical protein
LDDVEGDELSKVEFTRDKKKITSVIVKPTDEVEYSISVADIKTEMPQITSIAAGEFKREMDLDEIIGKLNLNLLI